MQNLPQEVKEAIERLQEQTPNKVQVKLIQGKYYAFETYMARDQRTKRNRRVTHYLGRIGVDGAFSPAKKRWKKDRSKRSEPAPREQTDNTDLIILQHLSMNARMPLSVISKRTGLSVSSVEYRIKKLEDTYGIRYIAEIDTNRLGFFAYMVAVKFSNEVPDAKSVRDVLINEPRVQLCMLTVGKYQMLMYLVAESNRALADVIGKIRGSDAFSKYTAKWYITPFYTSFGFVPLRDEFFNLLKERVWQRSRDSPRPKPENILYRDYALLKELSSNGSVQFSEIDKKYKLQRSSAQYTYHKLVEKGLIKRITITVAKPQGKRYDGIILANYLNDRRFVRTRDGLLKYMIEQSGHPVDRFALVGEFAVPDGMLFIMPVFSETAVEMAQSELLGRVKGINASTQICTDVIIGKLGYRRFDQTFSNAYKTLVERYGYKKANEIIY